MLTFWGKYISVLHRQEQKYVTRSMKEYGLGYSSYNFLLQISVREGCNQKQLSKYMAMDEALATRTIRTLVEQGYLTRKKDRANPRSYSLYITDQGKSLIPLIQKTLSDWWAGITEDLDENQKEILAAQLQSMSEKALNSNIETEEEPT